MSMSVTNVVNAEEPSSTVLLRYQRESAERVRFHQGIIDNPGSAKDLKSRAVRNAKEWEEKWREVQREIELRGNEALTKLVARVRFDGPVDKWDQKAVLKQHGVESGLPDDLIDVRPVRGEGQTLGLWTSEVGVQTYHRLVVNRVFQTIALPEAYMKNWNDWSHRLGVFPTMGPYRVDGPDPRPSTQSLMHLLAGLDPQLVSDTLKPLIDLAKEKKDEK